jgi:Ribbon-helix-helix domain
VLLTEEQDRRLEALARRLRTSKTSLVREGVDILLRRRDQTREPLLDLIGLAGRVGRRDGSERHDALLARESAKRPR